MAKKAFRARIENLERRDTPSAAGAVSAAATTTIAVAGSGKGVVTQFNNRINSYEIQANVHGTSSKLGKFTAAPVGQIYFNGNSVGTTVIAAANGDTLTLNLTGTGRLTHAAAPASVSYKFTVTGGTGAYANATGSGHATGTFNVLRGPATFSFRGKVKV